MADQADYIGSDHSIDTDESNDQPQEQATALNLNTAESEFYDPDADARDEAWVQKLRQNRKSDAILSCPLCFTTVCVECQQHEEYEDQFRAMFGLNCRIDTAKQVRPTVKSGIGSKKRKQSLQQNEEQQDEESYYPVYCAACDTEIGLREIPREGVYHFFNVVASNP